MKMLEVNPPELLSFCKTPSRPSPTETLTLTNKSDRHVAFKVKTTEPKSYGVKPSTGTLRPNETGTVTITLTNLGENRKNHRFMVQAHAVQQGQVVSREDWASFKKESIEEQRLNVNLEESMDANSASAQKDFSGSAENSSRGQESTETRPSSAQKDFSGSAENSSNAPGWNGQEPADLQCKYDDTLKWFNSIKREYRKLQDRCDAAIAAQGAAAARAAAMKGESLDVQVAKASEAAKQAAEYYGVDANQAADAAARRAKEHPSDGKADAAAGGSYSLLTLLFVALIAALIPRLAHLG